MSAKSVIQKLQDSDLIRLFLQFVQTYSLQYEKMSKQISYKCYEATWILVNFKANGYGRTQSQAYKHALRNLLQILIQQPSYTQFFVQALNTKSYNTRPSIKKQPLNQCNSNYAKKIISSKTQGYEPVQKQIRNKIQTNSKLYESFSTKPNQRSQTKFNTKTMQSSSSNYQTKNSNLNIGMMDSSYHHSQNENTLKNKLISSVNKNPNKMCLNDLNSQNPRSQNQPISQQLRKALKKLAQMEQYLININKQNQTLKKQLVQLNQQELKQQQHQKISFQQCDNIFYTEEKQNIKNVQVLNQIDISTSFKNNKPNIPKLKLQILPNYHKKSQKSLNLSLLAAYNQKRDPSVKKLIC